MNQANTSKGINAYKQNEIQMQASKMEEAMASVEEALESGDLDSAQDAFSKIQEVSQSMQSSLLQ